MLALPPQLPTALGSTGSANAGGRGEDMKNSKGSYVSSRALWLGASTAVISMVLAMPAQAADKSDATANAAAGAAQDAAAAPESTPANAIVVTGVRKALQSSRA